jgi:hypothetical protein
MQNAIVASRAGYTGARRVAILGARSVRRLGNRTPSVGATKTLTVTRSTQPFYASLTAGALSLVKDIALTDFQYTDLTGVYDRYRVNWVEVYITPSYDPGQSGVTNNGQIALYLACDPGVHYSAPTPANIGSFDNHIVKYLTAGRTVTYRYYPKPTNTLSGGNFASSTDWLYTSSTGPGVVHPRLLLAAVSPNVSDVLGIQIVYKINVTLKGVY